MSTRLFQIVKKNLGNKYNRVNVFFEAYNYDVWFENGQSTDATKPALEGDEKVKE